MTDPTEIARVAAGLTRAQREAVEGLDNEWAAGPNLDLALIDHLYDLRMAGLVERHFMDSTKPRLDYTGRGVTVRIGACWFFRLTELGLAVRDHILREKSGG